jgi:hypothetical protein
VIFQNDRRSYVSEDLRRSIQAELRRIDLDQSRAGGIRTHDIRLLKHVLQLGSRSLVQTSEFRLQVSGLDFLKTDTWLLKTVSVARPGIEPGTSR